MRVHEDLTAFVHDYEAARGAPFTAPERELLDAANLALMSYGSARPALAARLGPRDRRF